MSKEHFEHGPNQENKIDFLDQTIFDRLERLNDRIPRLAEDFNLTIQVVAEGETYVSPQQFDEICNRNSVRPEYLNEWTDEYFDEHFEETVAIITERRAGTIEDV